VVAVVVVVGKDEGEGEMRVSIICPKVDTRLTRTQRRRRGEGRSLGASGIQRLGRVRVKKKHKFRWL
jgi:hypothetical protein